MAAPLRFSLHHCTCSTKLRMSLLLIAFFRLQAFNIPLGTFIHTRALTVAISYVSGQLSPPGTQTSLWGLISFPVRYFAYVLVAIDFIIGGKEAALSALTGIIVGHLWWWGVWDSRALREFGTAPDWLRAFVETPPPPGPAPGAPGGSSSRSRRTQTAGYNWGSGHRLGNG
jgi:Derlin-2/3